MTTKTRYLSNLLATTVFCGAISVAAPAWAQDEDQDQPPQTGPVEAAPAQSATGDDDTIYVTGSRIPQPNLTATSPVTVVNSQEVRLTGTTRTEDLINSLPQAFAAQGANIANGSTGTANLNLRGLGSDRTLVLVNGRRLVPGSPNQNTAAADINIIPAAMVDRVDVLTGGASSVYGADAVAGVVNFIMDTDFEGIRLDSQYSFYQHENSARPSIIEALEARGFGYPTGNVADGGTWDVTLAIGAGFDDGRGHVTAYAGYRNIQAVLQGKRDYSSCALSANSATAAVRPGGFTCGGSATSNITTFAIRNFVIAGQANANRGISPGFTPYNFGPINHYQRPDERYVAGLFAEYEISRALQPYMEFMFMDDRTIAQIAASGNFFVTSTINCDNPLLGAQQRAVFCAPTNLVGFDATAVDNPATPLDERATIFNASNPGGAQFQRGILYPGRRNVEGGGRQDTLQHTTYRVVAGMRGDLSDVWSYDAFYQFGRVNFAQTYLNDFSVTRLTRALDIVDNPATPGVDPVCRSVLDGTDPNCVPYDLFTSAPGAINPAALDYLQTPGFARGFTEETVAGASLTGSLGEWGVQFPWAQSGVGVALGVEYRKERLDVQYDIAFQTGDLAGQGAASLPISGDFDVREAFAEARIPIIEENFIHELSLELGYRYSDYGVLDRSFTTDTYKIAGFFAPIQDIRFRGGYNRAVRAPNIIELFSPQRVALDGSEDPCAGPAVGGLVNGFTAAQCARTGVSAAQFGNITPNPADQYNGLIGGNPNLDPEISDTWTLGVVIQPRFIPRLALTVDFFDIEIEGAIQGIGADNIINACLNSNEFCNLIVRAPGSGSLWAGQQGFIIDTTQNIGGLSTRGVDIGASYSFDLGGMGNLGFNFVGTWLDELITDSGVGVVYDCVGFYGNQCLTPNPEWRHTARVSWNHPDGYGVSVRWRYFGSVEVDDLSDDPDLSGPNIQPENQELGSVNYIDLALSFRVGDHYAFRLGVNNLLDREPPTNGSQVCPAGPCNGNTWAQVYDALGRYIFAGVTLNF